MGKSKFQISRSLDEKIRRIIESGPNDSDSEFASVTSAYILGFNYGNVTNCVGLTTNYQLHHAVFPVVGLVFFKNSPADDQIEADLKLIKEYSSSPNGLGSFKSERNEHLFLIYSVDAQTKEVDKRIFNFSKGTFVRRKRHRLIILNDPFCPRNVYDGSEDVFNLDNGDSLSTADDDQVDHLIFFIHGVGGVCDVRFRSCVDVVADFKKMANTLLAQQSNPSSGTSTPTSDRHPANGSLKKGFFRKHSQESTTSRNSDTSGTTKSSTSNRARKVECLPISWHSLTRRQTGFSEQLNVIGLGSVPKLRHFLNKVVMDALLYSSGPVHTQTIMSNVGNEINRLYTLFMERHPNFNGSISLAGHSLGSVIVFDLLAHQIPMEPTVTPSTESKSPLNEFSGSSADENYEGSNLNNNNIILQETDKNTRQNCRNASHHHHNIIANDHRYCANYENLEELLKDMELTNYAELFHKEHIDLDSLLLLTDLDMKELGLPMGVRRKLGTYINFTKVSKIPMTLEASEWKQQQHEQYRSTRDKTATNGSKISCNPFCNMNTGQCLIQYPQLKFKPRCFFSFGSPTTLFLNVRGMLELSSEYKLPTCDRMLNIYHPYDPLAYRFEPLIDPRFKNVEPVLIPHHRGGKRIHVQLREGFAKVGHDIKHRLLGSLRNTWTSFTRLGTANVSPEFSRSASVISSSEANEAVGTEAGTGAKLKRQKLTKSKSSSIEMEKESFETCSSNLSDSNLDRDPVNQPRNPLKRQDQIIKSQSEVHASFSTTDGRDSFSSIIDSSVKDHVDSGSDPDAAVLDKLKTFNLGQTSGINVAASSSSELPANQGQSADHCVEKDEGQMSGASAGMQAPEKSQKDRNKADERKSSVDESAEEFDKTKVGRLNEGRRIDYVLQEKPIELFNEYIFAFTSHANYWQNEDSALIILNEIYQADGVEA